MANQRKEGKRLVGFFATEEEAVALMQAAHARGLTVADFLRQVIRDSTPPAAGGKQGAVNAPPPPKAKPKGPAPARAAAPPSRSAKREKPQKRGT